MSGKDDGGPAFPLNPPEDATITQILFPGMNLIDYFAGQALAGMLSTYASSREYDRDSHDERQESTQTLTEFSRDIAIDSGAGCEEIAKDAYEFADAMIAERRRRDEENG